MKEFPDIHPGERLLEEFGEPLGISQSALARAADVAPRRINGIVPGKRSITADAAVRIAAAPGTSERFWLASQADTTWKWRIGPLARQWAGSTGSRNSDTRLQGDLLEKSPGAFTSLDW